MSKLELVIGISANIMSIGIAVVFAMVIIQFIDYSFKHKLNKGCVITSIIGFIVFIISLLIFVKSCRIYHSPELRYERLLNDLDETEKELQKFYIDHPEFKKIKE